MNSIEIVLIGNTIAMIKNGYGLVLWRSHSRWDYWLAVCTCGCRAYPKKDLENLAKDRGIKLLFESHYSWGGFENEAFSTEEIMAFIPEGPQSTAIKEAILSRR